MLYSLNGKLANQHTILASHPYISLSWETLNEFSFLLVNLWVELQFVSYVKLSSVAFAWDFSQDLGILKETLGSWESLVKNVDFLGFFGRFVKYLEISWIFDKN